MRSDSDGDETWWISIERINIDLNHVANERDGEGKDET